MRIRHRLLLLLVPALASATPAFADTFGFTLLDPAQAGGPGTVFTYSATVSAPISNTGSIYLLGDSFNTTGPLSVDDADFNQNFPLSLDPGQSFTGELFTLTSFADSAIGTTSGSFVIEGGPTDGSDDVLGTVGFTAQVTPEPPSVLLLASGCALVWMALRKRSAYSH